MRTKHRRNATASGMMQPVVCAAACPLLHGFCAQGELGQVRLHAASHLLVLRMIMCPAIQKINHL